jgi:hypothetical protein
MSLPVAGQGGRTNGKFLSVAAEIIENRENRIISCK